MLSLPGKTRVFLCTQPTDMRKSFDGLMGLVETILDQDPLSGHLFLFINRRRDRLKAMWWDHDGLAIFYKRLERGTWQMPTADEAAGGLEVDADQLALMLRGIDLTSARKRRRYQRPSVPTISRNS